MTDEKVLVRIHWTECVRYESEVTMTRSEYEKFNAQVDRRRSRPSRTTG